MKDAKGHGSNARGGAAHQSAVNKVGSPWRLNSHTHEIVSPTGDVAARLRLGRMDGLAVDVPGMGRISRSSGPSIHDAVAMPDYRNREKGEFPAEHIGGALHFLTGNDFIGHTVRRVKK